MKKRPLFLTLLIMVLMAGCTDDKETKKITESSAAASELNFDVGAYFPKLNTVNEYISTSADGTSQQIIETAKISGGLNGTNERVIESVHFQDDKEIGRDIETYTLTETFLKTDNGEMKLRNKIKWKSKGLHYSIEGTNETVEVKGGTFDDCILVLSIDKETGFKTKTIYTKDIGIIKMSSQSKGKEEKVLAELVETKTVSENEANDVSEEMPEAEPAEPSTPPEAPAPAKPEPVQVNKGALIGSDYVNESLGFSMKLPEHWDGKVTFETGNWAEEASHTVDFYYSPVHTNVFSILVYEGEKSEEEIGNPFAKYITAENGKTFMYVEAAEPSEALLLPENADKLEFVQNMIYEDLPAVIQSFQAF